MARTLPSSPSLQHLRNEAKALLKAHRTGNAGACESLCALPRFAGKSDRELLHTPIELSDMQSGLARSYGFESWTRLKAHVEELEKRRNNGDGLLGTAEAWEAIESGVARMRALPGEATAPILSMNVIGSLVRGDFVTGRSHVVMLTVCDDTVSSPAMHSEVRRQVRPCFGNQLDPYAPRIGGHPLALEDVWVNRAALPVDDITWIDCPLHALSLNYFDTYRHHRTVWGVDIGDLMPDPGDPRPGLPEWFARRLVRKGDVEVGEERSERMAVRAWLAVRALSLYYGDELSIHKDAVTRGYRDMVPRFPRKSFGWDHWQRYLLGKPKGERKDRRTTSDFFAFLVAAAEVLKESPRVFG